MKETKEILKNFTDKELNDLLNEVSILVVEVGKEIKRRKLNI
jgi:hypothetical protein